MTYPDGIPADVCHHFETIALDLHRRGFRKCSADFVLHRIRWQESVERGNRAFKCNNNWTAPLARWFLNNNPQARGFFNLREAEADARPF